MHKQKVNFVNKNEGLFSLHPVCCYSVDYAVKNDKWYGFKSHVHWCACFVSWCADQGGYIKSGTIPKFSLVSDGISWFKGKGRWQRRSYKPASGDIIFFDWEGDGKADHVGIVERCDGKTVYTIEGNSSNKCKQNSYSVGSGVIYCYGVPKY